MDKVIEKKAPDFRKVVVYVVVAFSVMYGLYSLTSSDFRVPSIDRDNIRVGEVKRGKFDVLVSGNGVVSAKDPEWIVAKVSGQVVKSTFKAGELIQKGDVLVQLINEDVVSALAKSESELRAAKADLSALEVSLQSQLAGYKSDLLIAELNFKQAVSLCEALKKLKDNGIVPISEIEYVNANVKLEQMSGLVEVAKIKLDSFTKIEKTQLEAFKFRLTSLDEENIRFKSRVNELNITASKSGIVQNLNLKVGQGVVAADPIAQIIDPTSLYITMNIPAIQAFKLSPSQKVHIELNKKIIHGFIHRIDPNVKGTTVDVDVYFDEEIKEAKVGMFVNGTVLIQSIQSTMYIDIPSGAAENSNMSLFLISGDDKFANMIKIKSGALSSNYLQVLDGLQVGDKVVISDIPGLNGATKLRLN